MTMTIPNAITLVGFIFGFTGCFLHPCIAGAVLLLVSLACDALDGFVARRYGLATESGARLDWTVDRFLAFYIAAQWFPAVFALPWFIALSVLHGSGARFPFRGTWHRVSGRTHITFAAIILWAVSHS